jgi:uncharacterized membrane protein YczE
MVVLNCIVIACFACVYTVGVDGSVFWGLFFVALMIGQIVRATRPERPSKEARRRAGEGAAGDEVGRESIGQE